MKLKFNSCSDMKGLGFFTKENCTYYCYYTHKKTQEGPALIGSTNYFP